MKHTRNKEAEGEEKGRQALLLSAGSEERQDVGDLANAAQEDAIFHRTVLGSHLVGGPGDTVEFQGAAVGGIPFQDADNPYGYYWQTGGNPVDEGQSTAAANTSVTFNKAGVFTISLTVTDSRRGESDPDLIEITVQDASLAHSDTDGIPDSFERGPDGTAPDYDGNGDQIPDQAQNNVASMPTSSGDDYVTIASEEGTFLSDVAVMDGASAGPLPDGFRFPQQFIAFTVNNVDVGGTTVVTIYLPEGQTADTYYKYGPTPGDADPHWYEFMWNGTTGAQINGNVITLTFVDGQRGDDDLVPEGKIVDLGGPGVVAGTSGGGGSGGCFVNSVQF